MLIYQTKQIRELETLGQERFGISADVLMQRAGKAACEYLMRRWPKTKRLGIVCGSGNNGGDGYVLASSALKRGLKVSIWQVGNTHDLKGSALRAFKDCESAGVVIKAFDQHSKFENVDVLADAVLGIGLKGKVRDKALHAITAINASNLPILAIDIPSGVDADTGKIGGIAVKASATITFIGLKLGLLTGQGIDYVGEWYCDDIGLPAELYHQVKSVAEKINVKQFNSYLAPRPNYFHKGDGGHVLIIGGDYGYSGATRMAAEAALRVGAGLVSVATRSENTLVLTASRPEIMCHGIRKATELSPLLAKATVVVIGPGLGQSTWSMNLLKAALKCKKPLVVDADGLNLLAKKPLKNNDWILTPHPGEAARLLKTNASDIQQNRLAAVLQVQNKFGGVCVLKGAGSLIASAAQPALCAAGNPGMATAGMGDILSGIIAGLLAQGIAQTIAAKLAVCLHAEAGDIAALAGQRGMIATDLLSPLRILVNP